jgi:hypothetical protein
MEDPLLEDPLLPPSLCRLHDDRAHATQRARIASVYRQTPSGPAATQDRKEEWWTAI